MPCGVVDLRGFRHRTGGKRRHMGIYAIVRDASTHRARPGDSATPTRLRKMAPTQAVVETPAGRSVGSSFREPHRPDRRRIKSNSGFSALRPRLRDAHTARPTPKSPTRRPETPKLAFFCAWKYFRAPKMPPRQTNTTTKRRKR